MGRRTMTKQIFDIEDYWKVIVYYDVDYNFFGEVTKRLRSMGASEEDMKDLYRSLSGGRVKAFTYSNTEDHVSLMVFNRHTSKEDYVNSIVHEAEHVKQAMLRAYMVDDRGEAPAYTIGYLVSCMYRVFKKVVGDYECS